MSQAGSESVSVARDTEFERLVASVRDALTDDIVMRLSATIGDSLDLADRVNRSGAAKALPAIARLVEDGDLDRLVGLARLMASAEDALSDDIVHRLALVVSESASFVDRLVRNEGFWQLVGLLTREDVQSSLTEMIEAARVAQAEAHRMPPSRGGLFGLWQLLKQPSTQDILQIGILMGNRLRQR